MQAEQLSGGFLKRLCLACAFVGNPDVVLLDEPFLGLDTRFRGVLYRKLREWREGRLILVGTADREEAEAVSDRIFVLRRAHAVDYASDRRRKRISQLTLRFSSAAAYARGVTIVRAFAAGLSAVREEECIAERERFKVSLEVYDIETAVFRDRMGRMMAELHSIFDLCSSQCFIDFRIVEHPYDQVSYAPCRSDNRQMSSK
jgi:ABC-type multidrug transport system ATPase subunit